MGLRLYQAPPDSGTQSKPVAEKQAAHSRSSIRRSHVTRAAEQIRERRRRILGHNTSHRAPAESRTRNGHDSAATLAPDATAQSGASTGQPDRPVSESGRAALRDMAHRIRFLDDRLIARVGERWAHLHAFSSVSPSGPEDSDHTTTVPPTIPPGPIVLPPMDIGHASPSPPPPTEPYATSNVRSTQVPDLERRTSDRRRAPRGDSAPQPLHDPRRELGGLLNSYRWTSPSHRAGFTPGPGDDAQPALIDGLGDRNRSLSPEGDHVWDTLLSTVTPDPQPPSVGSSFASGSASLSAALSQDATTGSSATPLTLPDMVDGPSQDPPCDSGRENSDTEGDNEDEEDDGDEMDRRLVLPRITSGDRRPTYADVTRNNTNDDPPLELLGGIGGMQHIVRSLARREDIPDEWWAEAGLSRTLPRDDTAN